MKIVGYAIKVLRKDPYQSYYLAKKCLCRGCTYDLQDAEIYETFKDAMSDIRKFRKKKGETPMVVEVRKDYVAADFSYERVLFGDDDFDESCTRRKKS